MSSAQSGQDMPTMVSNEQTHHPASARRVLPLIRHFSAPVSATLIRTPISANQITFLSLIAGLTAVWFFAQGGFENRLIGAVIFTVAYVLDHADGEVARGKNQASKFGARFDSFVDWIVHSAFFAALGWGVSQTNGQDFWFWLGLVGAAGATINYWLVVWLEYKEAGDGERLSDEDEPSDGLPVGWKQWLVYAGRELARSDFCFIVLVLALFDLTWILLPTAAIGAHAYWLGLFVDGARNLRA